VRDNEVDAVRGARGGRGRGTPGTKKIGEGGGKIKSAREKQEEWREYERQRGWERAARGNKDKKAEKGGARGKDKWAKRKRGSVGGREWNGKRGKKSRSR